MPYWAYSINLSQYSSNGPNYTDIGPNGVELRLKTVTFWLDRAPPRSGMWHVAGPLKKKSEKKKNSAKKRGGSEKKNEVLRSYCVLSRWVPSVVTSKVHQEAQIRSQKQIPLKPGLRVADLDSGRFF